MPVLISLPEQNEGKEANFTCVVDNNDLEKIKEIVLGKGLGVQGYDDGVSFLILSEEEFQSFDFPYALLKLSLDQLQNCISEGELNWHKIIKWQRWGYGYVDKEIKTIILHKKEVEISSYFVKCGFAIKYLNW